MAKLKLYRGLHWGRRKENDVWLRRRPAGNGYGRLRVPSVDQHPRHTVVRPGGLPPHADHEAKESVMADYPTALELAEVAYGGYAAQTGGKTFDGRDMPSWTDLPERTVKAWIAAVVAIHVETGFTMRLDEPTPGVPAHTTILSITVTSPDGDVTQVHPPVSGSAITAEWNS